jgi:hypothetical protein
MSVNLHRNFGPSRRERTHLAFFVQQCKYPEAILDQIDARLVVHERYKRPGDFFANVFRLLQGKDMRIKLLLEFFVGVIDAKLLKAARKNPGSELPLHRKRIMAHRTHLLV